MKKSGVLLGVALLAASAVHAEGFYVLGAVGLTRLDEPLSRDDLEDYIGGPLTRYSEDTSDTAYKLQVGYQFTDYFAIEGGYVDLGSASVNGNLSGTVSGVPVSYTAKVDWEAKGFNLAGVLTLPVNAGWSLFFKLGAINAEVEAKAKEAVVIGSTASYTDTSADDTSIKGNFGFGVDWTFMQHVGVRAEVERFSKLGDSDKTGESDVDLFSLAAYYQF